MAQRSRGAAATRGRGAKGGAKGGGPAAQRAATGPGPLGRLARAIASQLGERRRDLIGVLLLLAGVLLGLALHLDAAGPVGAAMAWTAVATTGLAAYLVAPALVAAGILLVLGRPGREVGRLAVGGGLTAMGLLAALHLAADVPSPGALPGATGAAAEAAVRGGGAVGWLLAAPLDAALSRTGAWVAVVALLGLGVLVAARLELRTVLAGLGRLVGRAGGGLAGAGTGAAARLRARAAAADPGGVGPGEAAASVVDLVPPPVEDAAFPVPWADDAEPEVDPDATRPIPVVAPDDDASRTDTVWGQGDTKPLPGPVDDADGTDVDAEDRHDTGDDTEGGTGGGDARPRRARRIAPPGERPPYELPPLDLLAAGRAGGADASGAEAQARALQDTFTQFGIDARVVRTSRGPTVTRFEVEVGPGVKVAKVVSLGDDIAYALAAPDVRIVAPIPGRSAIGIEVPNQKRDLIALGDVLRSDVARKDQHPLSVALGVDIAGAPVMVDLATMPHLLVSGSTGSGKSVTLNGMIASILMRARPDQVRMLLVDPKRVELGVYEGAPHLLAPVVTDPRRAADAVQWCVKEMEQRYQLLALLGFRNIDGYNEAFDRGQLASRPGPDGLDIEPVRMPYVLLVIDELADLMLVAPRDVEDAICRIAQMARAVGIHMVIATQRPSVDVITGLIKANIPSRLALAVASQTDSRTILDAGGAEKLVGRGDMLFQPASQGKPSRLQGCWVTEAEIAEVVRFCRHQREAEYDERIGRSEGTGGAGGGRTSDDSTDEGLLRRAAEQVVESGLGSTSMLQRKLRIGFARAGRLMDELEQVGCVGPSEGSKAREVLWDEERLRAALEDGLI
jgi:S-DNA-T family DNA segregation ATPase FtsK/SpoIIIE